ncbi:MAG: hypothetical protein JWM72_1335 [Actinomycetia bacterium]|jgi:hypothetical protein|nr:hypothetical protein [Actinomycetes bacterium]MDQ1460781.1 hypothetical protein [Actinomycetota bacterium]
MYLYSTSARSGVADPVKVMEWALSMTEKINQISEVRTSLWTSAMSPAMGTMAWTSVVSDLAIIEDTEAKLAADPGYAELVGQATALLSTDPADQTLMQLVHADPDAAGVDARYALTTRATLAPGSMVAGIELGVELAQKAKKITDRPTSFAVSVTGDYGAVMWVSMAETIQQVQASIEALNSDPDFAKAIDNKAGKAYLPGATETISRKIA